jgi:AcrR family transcriptional regulator
MPATEVRRRRLRPEQRRELIVSAAAEEFGRHGHRAARLEDIARRAGTTKAVIYDHFAGKDALHAEVVGRAGEDLLRHVAAAVGAFGERAGEERYRAGILASFQIIAERPDVRTLLLGGPGVPDAVLQRSQDVQATARMAMAALYLSEPEFLRDDPDREEHARRIAQAGIGLINGLAALGAREALSPEELTDVAMEVLWGGISSLVVQTDP